MSFGFSVSDFVLLAEKAYLVYRRCKDAPGKYTELTKRVFDLRATLDETQRYLLEADEHGEIPQDKLRLASLHSTCEGCNTTLDEVDNFLERYSDVTAEKGTKRVISRLKFIRSDSATLERKLELDASSLQLRLTSLTSLSVLALSKALPRIAEEYRTGKRQPTVVSHPVIDNKIVEKEEMFVQISQDLEDVDVHPDTISLNKSFVDEWLSKVIENGGLAEGASNPVPELRKITSRDKKMSGPDGESALMKKNTNTSVDNAIMTDRSTALSNHNVDTAIDDTSRPDHKDGTNDRKIESIEGIVSNSPNRNTNISLAQQEVVNDENSKPESGGDKETTNKEAVVFDDNDDLYADPDHVTTRPEDSMTVVAMNTSTSECGQSRSRAASTASSAGKPEEWHPYTRPDPQYVREKLYPLFHEDPTPDTSSESTKRRIMRAFHQADYSDKGFLTRRVVLQHLTTALDDSPMKIDADNLESVVLAFDANHDGQFDDDEFLGLIQELMRRTAQARVMELESEFANIIKKAKTRADHRRAMDSKFFLPWGFSRLPGPGQHYVDDILNESVELPPKVLEYTAFSVMAWEANICVDKISDFEENWIGIVPQMEQERYLEPLRKVQQVARAFVLLENQSNRLTLSDLDTFLTCAQITSEVAAQRDSKGIEDIHSRLEAAKMKSSFILDTVLGFVEGLERPLSRRSSVNGYNHGDMFGKFKSWWQRNRLDWRSDVVARESAEWDSVKDAVHACRKLRSLADMESLARIVAEDFVSREDARVRRLQAKILSTPWPGTIDQASLSGWSKNWMSKTIDKRMIFLRISITEPTQVIYTNPTKREVVNWWGPKEHEKDGRIHVLPSSTVTVAVMYLDNKRPWPQGTFKYEFPPQRLKTLDFEHRPGNNIAYVGLSGPPCDVYLNITMDVDPEFYKALESLKVADWRTLLSDSDANNAAVRPFASVQRGPAPDYTP